jgi:hypothetical protein
VLPDRRFSKAAPDAQNALNFKQKCADCEPLTLPLTQTYPIELAIVVDGWKNLPDHIRAAILALVQSADTTKTKRAA